MGKRSLLNARDRLAPAPRHGTTESGRSLPSPPAGGETEPKARAWTMVGRYLSPSARKNCQPLSASCSAPSAQTGAETSTQPCLPRLLATIGTICRQRWRSACVETTMPGYGMSPTPGSAYLEALPSLVLAEAPLDAILQRPQRERNSSARRSQNRPGASSSGYPLP